MRFLVVLFFYCLGIVGQPQACMAAAGDTTYATSPRHIQCGQTITGTLIAGTTIHQRVYEYGTGLMLFNLSDGQEVFRVELPADGYLIIKQPFATARVVCLGKDSSNRSITTYGGELYPYLSAGIYYLTMAGWAGDYSFEIICNVNPTSVFGNAKLWAESGTNNGLIRGSFSGAADHLQQYIRTYSGSTLFMERRGPERIYKIELPEDRNIEITCYPELYQHWYLIDSTGNPLDSVHHLPFRNVAAGTYYLSVEYDSAAPVDSFHIYIQSIRVPGTCVPHLDNTAPFDQTYPWIGGLVGSINGWGLINPSKTYTSWSSAYTDRYTEDYAEMYLNTYNSFRLTTPPGYMRLYVDFNEDGDFDEGDELVVNVNTKPRIPTVILVNHDWNFNATTSEKFLLSDTVASYRAASGKLLRYRVLVADTNDQGACGHYHFGIATDGRVLLRQAPSGPVYFSEIQTLNDAKIARYKAALPGPGGSFYGVGETVGQELDSWSQYRHGMSQIYLSDDTSEAAYYSRWSYHHSSLGTNNVVTRYKANGRLAWYRILDGYGDDGGVGGRGIVDIPGTGMTPDSGIVAICRVQSGIVGLGSFSNTIGTGGCSRGSIVVRYRPDGTLAMAHNFFGCRYGLSLESCAYGKDSSFYSFGSSDLYPPGVRSRIEGPLRSDDTISFQQRSGSDALLIKLLSSNRLGWMVRVVGSGHENGLKVSTSADGRVYILGTFDTAATVISTASTDSLTLRGNGPHSGYLVALSDSGRPLWARTWAIDGANWDNDPYYPHLAVPIHLTTDAQGQNIVVAGGFQGPIFLDSIVLRSVCWMDGYGMGFDRDGHLRWAKSFGTASDEEVSTLTPQPDGMLGVAINYTASIHHVFGDGVLEAGGWRNAAVVRIDPSTGMLVHGPGFIRLAGDDSLSLNGLYALPGGRMLVAGYSGNSSYLTGWGMLSHEGFVGMAAMTADTVPFVVPTEVHKPGRGSGTLNVYPNPSTGQIHVRHEQATGPMPVTLLDAQGRTLLAVEGEGAELRSGYALPIRLPPGLYLVRCGTATARVIVH